MKLKDNNIIDEGYMMTNLNLKQQINIFVSYKKTQLIVTIHYK